MGNSWFWHLWQYGLGCLKAVGFGTQEILVGNIGPAFGEALVSYASFSYFSKIVLSFVMLFGRLEIMPMLILMSPATGRKN